MRILKPGGRALIYVWAFEQEYNKLKSNYLKDQDKKHPENHTFTYKAEDSREPHGKSSTGTQLEDNHETGGNIQNIGKETDGKLTVHTNRTAFNTQDLLVPWHLKEGKRQGEEDSGESTKKDKKKEKSKRTSGNSSPACSVSSLNKSDCSADPSPGVGCNMPSTSSQDASENGDTIHGSTSCLKSESSAQPVFHRYYHVFQQGELEQLCVQVTGVKVQSSYHDQGNWCAILEKIL